MKWKTKEGKVLDIQYMSDLHLINAYKKTQEIVLYREARRRYLSKFFNQTDICPYCNSNRSLKTIEVIEVGFSPDKYRLECTCGSCSAYLKQEPFNEEKWLEG